MTGEDVTTRALALTDVSLRAFFPNDFHKRCMYAAFGLSSLLQDSGVSAQVIGGDFLCALVSSDGTQMSLQGFGSSGQGEPSHFWVETQGFTLDLGPTYLPYESRYPAPSPPIIRWPVSSSLPAFLAYRERVRLAEDVVISSPEIRQRNAEFVACCRQMNRSEAGRMLPNAWQLKDYQSLRYAASKKDPWALAASEFLRRSLKAEFPY